MARFNFENKDNYGTQGNRWFSLKDDGDTAKIRFLYNDINDVQGVTIHEIEVEDKRVDVECLRAYNEPVENCPLCGAGFKISTKLFVPVYDESSKETKIWTRGKTYFNRLSGLCARYNPLVSTVFDIERSGKAGDRNTTYGEYATKTDDKKVEDFPEINPEEFAFQVKTFEDLEFYLQNGIFPEDTQVPQRNNTQVNRQNRTQPATNGREVPSTPIRRRPNYNEEESF